MSDPVFSLFAPRHMRIGAGAVGQVAEVLGLLGLRRPLVVTDPVMVATGLLRRCLDPLAAAGMEAAVFSDTVAPEHGPEPTDLVVEEGGCGGLPRTGRIA